MSTLRLAGSMVILLFWKVLLSIKLNQIEKLTCLPSLTVNVNISERYSVPTGDIDSY